MKSFEDNNILIKAKLLLEEPFFWKKLLFEKNKHIFENKNMFLKNQKNFFEKKTF